MRNNLQINRAESFAAIITGAEFRDEVIKTSTLLQIAYGPDGNEFAPGGSF